MALIDGVFDEDELERILRRAGFKSPALFVSLRRQLLKASREMGMPEVEVEMIHAGLTEDQIDNLGLPRREPKPNKKWPYDWAVDLDAMSSDQLKDLVRGVIMEHITQADLDAHDAAEEEDRVWLRRMTGQA